MVKNSVEMSLHLAGHLKPTLYLYITMEMLGNCIRGSNYYGQVQESLYTNASEGSWPWHAILNKEGENYSKFCQATILSDTEVITAAHCIEPFITDRNKLLFDLYVFVGKHLASTWEATEQKIRVRRIYIHKDRLSTRNQTLGSKICDNDLALLKLENNIKYSPYVRPACFPQSSKRGNVCIATGWNIQYAINTFSEGIIKFGKSAGLKELEMKFYDDYVCDLLLAAEQHIQSEDHNFLCGTSDSLESPTWATLQGGDSGGPLVCYQNGHWELVGVSVAILQYGSIGKIVHLFMKVDNNWVREKLGLQRNFWDTDILWN
uniref:Suppressor of tumorigenicity 14 protein-like n=1 Tax=Phallusia mammillata TaxID=59560 RepID=A0A6F9DUH5_9ASCI|nr:suppressor of tumorigenicity 14 protein-like [Phallusia mammillata]